VARKASSSLRATRIVVATPKKSGREHIPAAFL